MLMVLYSLELQTKQAVMFTLWGHDVLHDTTASFGFYVLLTYQTYSTTYSSILSFNVL